MNDKDIIYFPTDDNFSNLAIKINRRTPEFMKAAHAVGDYLKTLPLSNMQHNKLVELLGLQIDVAEQVGFGAGLKIGLAVGREDGH